MVKYLTREGLEKLKKELEYLEKVERKEVSENLNEMIAQGDLKENAGYEVAKEKQSFIESRIKGLKEIIAQTEIIEKVKRDSVSIGSFVSLKSNGGKCGFLIVGPEEADVLDGKISFESPLGKAILNKKKGEIVKIDTPQGPEEYKIVKIS